MFSFFHPKPVVDGRPVAVKIVQQKALAQQDMRTLILATPGPRLAEPAANDGSSESVQTHMTQRGPIALAAPIVENF